jgi:hypothetical protein
MINPHTCMLQSTCDKQQQRSRTSSQDGVCSIDSRRGYTLIVVVVADVAAVLKRCSVGHISAIAAAAC